MSLSRRSRAARWGVLPLLAALCFGGRAAHTAPSPGFIRLPGHMPSRALASARAIGRLESDARLRLALTLPLRNPAGLADLIRRQQTPGDPLYGRYLTPTQFADRFAPTRADYDRVGAYVRSAGLTVVGTHPNRTVLDVAGDAATVERAFGVRLAKYRAAGGRAFHAPDAEPAVPAALAGKIGGVVGLDNSLVRRPRAHPLADLPWLATPRLGSGPLQGYAPSDIRTAYNLSSVSLTGSGQTLALFELDGYNPADVAAYQDFFGLRHVPLQNILLDGATGQPSTGAGAGADEVTLDVELAGALSPGLNKILVYEGANTDPGQIDLINRIATDNQAQEVSITWGGPESQTSAAVRNAENSALQQMAAQGQTAFCASGDNGAYDTGSTADGLSVDDPASQPYITGIGGTALTTSGDGGPYASETTWNGGSVSAGASGGGISAVWPLPSYQQGVVSADSRGSAAMRNVPDVALDADPNTGYAIYYKGGWHVYGGTSTAAPLWAGIIALVNQQRAANGQAALGFANPPLYAVGGSSRYGADFHDVADGSTNLFYPAVAGYDLTTGWGSLNGANLLADLAPSPAAVVGGRLAAGLNFVALPYDYAGTPLDTVFGFTGVTLAVWNPAQLAYVLTPTPPADAVVPGRGYWVRAPQAVTITTAGAPADRTQPFSIGLSTGWNQIGDPFTGSVALSALTFVLNGQSYSFAQASGAAGLIGPTLYRYNGGSGYVPLTATDSLQPGVGYWIRAVQPVTVQVPVS